MELEFLQSCIFNGKVYHIGDKVKAKSLPNWRDLVKNKVVKELPIKGASK